MALRWNELDDGLDSTPCSPRAKSPQQKPMYYSKLIAASDCWEFSGADETDCTQDDGDISTAGDEYHLPPQSHFPGQHRPARTKIRSGRDNKHSGFCPDAAEAAHAGICPLSSTLLAGSADAAGEWKEMQRPSPLTLGQGLRRASDQAKDLIESEMRERVGIRERGAAGRHGSGTRQRGISGDEAASRRRRNSHETEGKDDLIEGVWGLSWGRQNWASALESPIGQQLRAFSQRARGSFFPARCRDDKQRAAESCSASPTSLRGNATPDQDADADGDVSECEAFCHTTPSDAKTEASRVRSVRSVREHVRHVAVRAKELAATMGEQWQRKRRNARSQRQIRSDRMILLPGGNIRRAWDCIGLVLLLLLLLVQVVNERWKSQHKGWIFFDVEQPYNAVMLKIQVLLDVFFIVDIFVNFRTAYCDAKSGQYVKDAWRIADHYSRNWLLCDLFCAIPLDLLLDETPVVMREVQRKKGKTWLKRLVRRTGALHFLRVAASTRPFRGARCVECALRICVWGAQRQGFGTRQQGASC